MITVCMIRVAHMQGDLRHAEALCAENLAVFLDIGDEFGLASTRFSLGAIKLSRDDAAGAAPLLASAVTSYQTLGERLYVGASLEALAVALAKLGQAERVARFLGAAPDTADAGQRADIFRRTPPPATKPPRQPWPCSASQRSRPPGTPAPAQRSTTSSLRQPRSSPRHRTWHRRTRESSGCTSR